MKDSDTLNIDFRIILLDKSADSWFDIKKTAYMLPCIFNNDAAV